MATFASLTPTQQAQISDFQIMMRGNVVQLAKTINQMVAMQSLWNSNISVVAGLLTAGSVIPDATGYAGADLNMTVDDLNTYITAAAGIITANNTAAFKTFYARACGLQNAVANT